MKPIYGYSNVTEPFKIEHLKAGENFSINLQDLLSSKLFSFLIVDEKDFSIVFANQAAQNLYLYSEEELKMIPFYQLHTCLWGRILRLFSSSKVHRRKHYYAHHIRKDGSVIYVEIFFGPLKRHEETYYYVFIRDITEVKQAEVIVYKSEKQHRLLFQNLRYPFLCVENTAGDKSHDFTIKEANTAFSALVGSNSFQKKEEISVEKILNSVFVESLEFTDVFETVLSTNESKIVNVTTKETQKYFEVTIYRVDENSVALLFHDVTSQRNLDALRIDFINTLTHEIRTPLTSIKAGVEVWSDPKNKDIVEKENLPSIVLHNVKRLALLVNDILDYQKISTKNIKDAFTKQSINELIMQDSKSLLPLTNKKNIEVVYSLDESIQKSYFHKDYISRVLVNLFNNAIKFTNNGTIEFITKCKDNKIVVKVKDSGCGIKLQDQSKLFNTFYRANKKIPGTGLGLSISKKIIEFHNGSISFESELNVGTTFTFMIPYLTDDHLQRVYSSY